MRIPKSPSLAEGAPPTPSTPVAAATTAAGTRLSQKEVEWVSLTGMGSIDPLGRVFRHEGRFYRGIFPHQAAFVESLLKSGVLERLQEQGLLVPTRLADISIEGFGPVLEHDRVLHPLRPAYWTYGFLKDAALMFLDLNEILLEYGLCTIDGHTENLFPMRANRPVFIDVGSIGRLADSRRPDTGMEQFRWCFLYFLLLRSRRKHLRDFCRALAYSEGCISDEAFAEIHGKDDIPKDMGDRRAYIRALRKYVQDLPPLESESYWKNYHEDKDFLNFDFRASGDRRSEIIYALFRALSPRSAVDIGCNAGRFSMMLASLGADTYSFDVDEGALERFHERLRTYESAAQMTIGVHKVAGSADRYDFHRNPLPVQGELALSLALSHHLCLTQQMPLDFIAGRFASYSSRYLITEFMPYGLHNNRFGPTPLPPAYRLDAYLDALGRHFPRLSVFYYPVPEAWSFRVLVFGEMARPGESSPGPAQERFLVEAGRASDPGQVMRIVCEGCNHYFQAVSDEPFLCPSCRRPQRLTSIGVDRIPFLFKRGR